ncbi:N5-carboxyaminoimidazole ribonucleotide synthase [Planctomycetota bacterium]|nr:N5-carboxyaminoimidazole ribonucleotide synthase [Planctomycetota bacterium]
MRIAILGGGQLARMLALAAIPLGHRVRVLDPSPDAGAGHCAELIVGEYDDPAALDRLVSGCDVLTYEFENVPVAAAQRLALRLPVSPPPAALAVSQDRVTEKTFLQSHGCATAPFAAIADRAGLQRAVVELGLPAVLKTRRLGYDGKGQAVLRQATDLDAAWAALGNAPGGLILEGFVDFERECSLVAARGRDGAVVCYPLAENTHRGGILSTSLLPGPGLSAALQSEAERVMGTILAALDYVGVLCIEFFVADGRLIANEMAPRVHNSGHGTIEGCVTSQFANHIRAITGAPLGSPAARGASVMRNLIGAWPDPARILAIPGAHLHLYGKQPRAGRKVGHVTLIDPDPAALAALDALIG